MVGVDPPASVEGICGIVVCGADDEGNGYVLADLSVGGLSPEGWARRVAAAAEAWHAQRVVAEANNGGAMVAAVLRGAGLDLQVRLVHAADGKAARAHRWRPCSRASAPGSPAASRRSRSNCAG